MRKLVVIAVLACFALSFAPAVTSYAQGKSAISAKELTDDSAIDKVGDWFATRGKSDAEKQKVLAQRKANRVAARAQKKIEKQKREAQKKMQKQQKSMEKAKQDLKKGLGK